MKWNCLNFLTSARCSFLPIMRSFPSLYRFLNLIGLLQCEYSRKKDGFVIRSFMIPYSILFSLSLQTFLLVEGYAHINIIALSSFGVAHFDWFVTGGLLLFFTFYVILNLTTSLTILYNKKDHCKLLNELIEIEKESGSDNNLLACTSTALGIQKTFEMRVKLAYLAIVAIYFVAFPTYIFTYYGFNFVGFTRFISIYCHSIQYSCGHLYEMIIIEKMCANFKWLQEQINDEINLGQNFSRYNRYWNAAEKATTLFAFGKIPCLVCVNLILSLYWFCNYDRSQSFGILLTRQIVLYFIFFVCNNWHRLSSEVSMIYMYSVTFFKKS